MPEIAGVTIGELRRAVGLHLGYSRTPDDWSANQTSDVWDVLKTGLHQFYYPGRALDGASSYQWSFLKPIGQITMEAGVDEYDMPPSYASVIGSFYYDFEDFATREVTVVNESKLLQLRQRQGYDVVDYYPRYVAIVPRVSDELSVTQYRIMVWPTPDAAYTLRFKYYARQPMVKNDNAVPLGGIEHSETLRASCLAAAELHMDDEQGTRYSNYKERLQASIDFDRKASSPQTLGYNGDNEKDSGRGYIRSTRITTYEKYPL